MTYRYEGGIADFVRYLNKSKDAVHDSVIEFGEEATGISAEIAMQWSGSYAESVHTFANTINTAEGGTHEEGFRSALTTIVNRYAREQKLLREKDEQLTGDDVREGLTAIISGQAGRAAVRGPDQDQARQHRGEVLRAEGLPTTTCVTGSSATRARPRTSSNKASQAARARIAARQARDLTDARRLPAARRLPGKLSDCQSGDPGAVRGLRRRG